MRPMLRLVLLLAVSGATAACGGTGAGTAMPELTAVPVPGAADVTETLDPGSPTPSPTPTTVATPSDPVTTEAEATREPRDADRGAFVRDYRPEGAADLESVAADLDGEGTPEVVVTYVQRGEVRLDVAWWDGNAYRVDTSLGGGAATAVTSVLVRDLNADGLIEVAVQHTGEDGRGGLTLWRVEGTREVAGLIAIGGCHSGRSTYGAIGAALEDRNRDGSVEIYASCDDSPLARVDWSMDRYVWDDGAYRHDVDAGLGGALEESDGVGER